MNLFPVDLVIAEIAKSLETGSSTVLQCTAGFDDCQHFDCCHLPQADIIVAL